MGSDADPAAVERGMRSKRPRLGLRTRLLGIVALALLPAVALIFAYSASETRSAEEEMRADFRRLLVSQTNALDDLLQQGHSTLVAFSSSRAVTGMDWAASQDTAERIEGQQPEYVNVGVALPSGEVVVSAFPTGGRISALDRVWFQRAVRYKRFAVGDFQTGAVTRVPSFSLANPVLDTSGTVQSVAYVSLGLDEFRARLQAVPQPPGSVTLLLDSKGRLILREPEAAAPATTAVAANELVAKVISLHSGSVVSDSVDGVQREYYFKPVFQEPDGGLYLVIGFAPTEVFASQRRDLAVTLTSFGIFGLLAMSVAWLAGTFWVYRPVLQLQRAAGRLAAGDLTARSALPRRLDEIGSLSTEFDQMAGSIEQRMTLAQALAEVDNLVHSTLDFEEIMDRVLGEACDALGAQSASVAMLENGRWYTKYSYQFPKEITGVTMTENDAPHAALALHRGEPVAIDDTWDDPRVNGYAKEAYKAYGIRSVLAAPLMVQDRVIGVISMNQHGEPAPFSEAQISFAQNVAATIALALQNANLYRAEVEAEQRARRALDRSELLRDVASAAMADKDLGGLAAHLLDILRNHLKLKAGEIQLVDHESGSVELLASVGYPPGVADRVKSTSVASPDYISSRAARTGEILTHVEDMVTDERLKVLRMLGLEHDSYVSIPVDFGGVVVGLLNLAFEGRRQFTSEEIASFSSIARLAGQVIENARLNEIELQRSRLAEALDGINDIIHSTLRFDEIMQRSLDEGVRVLATDAGTIEVREDDSWAVRYQNGFEGSDVGALLDERAAPLATRAARLREAFMIPVISQDEEANTGYLLRRGMKSVLVVPLIVKQEVIGSLVFLTSKRAKVFSEAEMDFGRKLAASVSLAVENARLYEGEHRIADVLQQSLLALPEDIPGLVFAHVYHSASDSARVGGDFYDLFELEHGLIGMTVGDISGKGLNAAVLTSLIKNAVRTQANERGKTPADVIRLANDVLLRESKPEVFVTLFFGILDSRDGRLVYCNAGHTTAAIARNDGSIAKMRPNSPIAGAFASAVFDNSETRFDVDDLLFLYTDGLTEARIDGRLFGEERLFELLLRYREERPAAIVHRVVGSVLQFAGGTLSDDLAMLAIKRSETPPDIPTQQKLTFS